MAKAYQYGDEVFDNIFSAEASQRHWDKEAEKYNLNVKHKILKRKGKFIVRIESKNG